MDELGEYRARSYSVNSAQTMRVNGAGNRRTYPEKNKDNLPGNCALFEVPFSSNLTSDQACIERYSLTRRRKFSDESDFEREFSGMRLSRRDTSNSASRSVSGESAVTSAT